MHFYLRTLLVSGLFFLASLSPATADIFYIEDQDDRFTVSFPDTWTKIGNQKTDDKLVVVGPGQNDHASCRVRVRNDRRFIIYPSQYSDEIQRVHISDGFWDNYLGDYDEVTVDAFKDDSGLGRGHASMVEASYMTSQGDLVRKRGIMFASLFYDQLYVLDCSSEESVYDKWRPAFLSIIKSVDFDPVMYDNPNGHYRPFQNDMAVEVVGPKALDYQKN